MFHVTVFKMNFKNEEFEDMHLIFVELLQKLNRGRAVLFCLLYCFFSWNDDFEETGKFQINVSYCGHQRSACTAVAQEDIFKVVGNYP